METIDRRPVIPSISADAQILAAMLAKLEPGELLTYDAASAAIGRCVRTVARGILQTAIRRALRDHGIVVECVFNAGYRRVVGDALVKSQRAGADRIRGEARRRAEKLGKLDFSAVDNATRLDAAAQLSLYGVVAHLSTEKGIQRIAAASEKAEAGRLAIGSTLKLFCNGGT